METENPKIGVIGAGAMGRGIAQVSATGGMTAIIYDLAEGAAEAARDFIFGLLDRGVEKGRMQPEEAEAAKGRILIAGGMEDLAGCDLVVEAVVENLDVKRKVFTRLEEIVRKDAILASNTSSIRLASIAAACARPERVAGMHFFNPVPLMKLVEIIRAPGTSQAVVDTLASLGKRMGRVPVVVKDSPGFLVNLGGRAYVTEGLRIVSEGIAEPAQVDAVMRDACGFRMGPFELMDLTGIDVNFPVSQIIYNGYFQDRRLATSPLHESMMESGRLGRKTKAGYYDYGDNGKAIAPSADADTSAEPAARLVLGQRDGRLEALIKETGAEPLAEDDGVSPILCAPVGEDCTALSVRLGLDPKRLVAVDMETGVAGRATVMCAPGADAATVAAAVARLAKAAPAVTLVKDSPGFVAQRIRAMVANLGCEMAQIGVATPEDIDKGMTLGLNYPQGPLALADQMGPATVHAILTNLQAITGEDRYRPSQWLRRRALLGLSAHTPD